MAAQPLGRRQGAAAAAGEGRAGQRLHRPDTGRLMEFSWLPCLGSSSAKHNLNVTCVLQGFLQHEALGWIF
jgi:hypothetical protein